MGAAMMLLFLGWVYILVAMLYILTFQYPILFRSKRLGKDRCPFAMLKFRTLKVDETKSLDERKFWLGNLLRATSLDELPQLWNVLKGEMSLVGPRPLPAEYQPLFSEAQKKRFEVKPGITGLAQVNGRHSISWKKKFELDNYYVDHISPMIDIHIMIKTIGLLLSFKKDRSLEEEKFTGSN